MLCSASSCCFFSHFISICLWQNVQWVSISRTTRNSFHQALPPLPFWPLLVVEAALMEMFACITNIDANYWYVIGGFVLTGFHQPYGTDAILSRSSNKLHKYWNHTRKQVVIPSIASYLGLSDCHSHLEDARSTNWGQKYKHTALCTLQIPTASITTLATSRDLVYVFGNEIHIDVNRSSVQWGIVAENPILVWRYYLTY